MPGPREWLRDTVRTADAAALPALYAAVSVPADTTRAWLRDRGLPFLDPALGTVGQPRLADVDRTADHVIAQSQARAAGVGAVGGVAGWLALAPEVAAWVLGSLRMAQRLAVVYGFDPSSDRGHVVLSRAVAAGFEVDLPDQGLTGLSVSDLARAFRPAPIDPRAVGGRLARAVAWRSLRFVTGRVGRLLPVVASGVSAVDNHREAARIGERMKAVYRRLADPGGASDGRVVDAIEVVAGRR